MTTLYEPPEPSQAPTAFGFNPTDNNFFVIGLNNGHIILKALKQKKGWERPGHPTPITDLGFVRATKEKGTIITAGKDGSVKIWNFEIPSDKSTEFALNCKTTFQSEPFPIHIHFPPNQTQIQTQTNASKTENENFYFLIEQPAQLEIRSLDGKLHFSWVPPEKDTIAGVAYDCSGSHLYVLSASKKILYIVTHKLEMLLKVDLDKLYTTIASNPKEPYQITLGDASGQVVIMKFRK